MEGFLMNKRTKAFFILTVLLLISACTTYQYQPETGQQVPFKEGDVLEVTIQDMNDIGQGIAKINNFTVIVPDSEVNQTVKVKLTRIIGGVGYGDIYEEEEEVSEEFTEETQGEADIVAYEGDLIDLKPEVQDPDNDTVTVGFTAPFDEKGMWQTEEGDAGLYSVIVTATDNKGSFVTEQFKVLVLRKNRPPVFGISSTVEFTEGENINLDPLITDPDGDEVVVTYSGWMNSRTYQTTFDDAGEYKVVIKANDGTEIVSKTVKVVILESNRAPTLELSVARVEVTEGGLVEVTAEASDPDDDEIEISFSEPLNEEGQWQTEKGDEGAYTVEVTASDGVNEVTSEVLIEVLKRNEPPVITSLSVVPEFVELREPGDEMTVTINVEASDPDGDELIVTYSGFMDSSETLIEYGTPGGVKTVTVKVSDGIDSVSQDVEFEINNWPCFGCLE